MESFVAHRSASRLSTWLTLIISLTFLMVWLPLLRSVFDGSSYQWGMNYFGFQLHGAGITPSYLFLIVQLVFYVALFVSMYRVQNRKVYYVLLLLWFVHVFGNLLADIAINGDTTFEGDTLGVSISLFWIVLPLSALALLLIFLAIRADRRASPQSIPWGAKNRKMLWLILGPLPIQAILLASGEPHGLTDQIGVILTIVQCFLLPLVVRPYGSKLQPQQEANSLKLT